jgi:hypothetical protein
VPREVTEVGGCGKRRVSKGLRDFIESVVFEFLVIDPPGRHTRVRDVGLLKRAHSELGNPANSTRKDWRDELYGNGDDKNDR